MLREGTREAGVPAFSALQLKIQAPYCFTGFYSIIYAIMEPVCGVPRLR